MALRELKITINRKTCAWHFRSVIAVSVSMFTSINDLPNISKVQKIKLKNVVQVSCVVVLHKLQIWNNAEKPQTSSDITNQITVTCSELKITRLCSSVNFIPSMTETF